MNDTQLLLAIATRMVAIERAIRSLQQTQAETNIKLDSLRMLAVNIITLAQGASINQAAVGTEITQEKKGSPPNEEHPLQP